MASITFSLSGPCSGGNHYEITLTPDFAGLPAFSDEYHIDEVMERPSREELIEWARMLPRIVAIGRTRAQVGAALSGGRIVFDPA